MRSDAYSNRHDQFSDLKWKEMRNEEAGQQTLQNFQDDFHVIWLNLLSIELENFKSTMIIEKWE